MPETILIAVEDSEERMRPVVEYVTDLASKLSAEVVLYHVYEPEVFEDQLDSLDIESADPVDIARQNATVEAAASALREAGVDFSVAASTGDPAEEIVAYVESHDIDQVVTGARKQTPAGKALFGSVSQQVILQTDVPCTIISR
jgi:nucleotide-binding universal stress UspA family protein